MKQWLTKSNWLMKCIVIFVSLSGVLAIATLLEIVMGADFHWIAASLLVWGVTTAIPAGLAVVVVLRRLDASRRSTAISLERVASLLDEYANDLTVGLQAVRSASGDVPPWAITLSAGVSECEKQIAASEGNLRRSIGLTNRSIGKLDDSLRSYDLASKIEEQSNKFEIFAFNLARSQRQMEFAVLKDSEQA